MAITQAEHHELADSARVIISAYQAHIHALSRLIEQFNSGTINGEAFMAEIRALSVIRPSTALTHATNLLAAEGAHYAATRAKNLREQRRRARQAGKEYQASPTPVANPREPWDLGAPVIPPTVHELATLPRQPMPTKETCKLTPAERQQERALDQNHDMEAQVLEQLAYLIKEGKSTTKYLDSVNWAFDEKTGKVYSLGKRKGVDATGLPLDYAAPKKLNPDTTQVFDPNVELQPGQCRVISSEDEDAFDSGEEIDLGDIVRSGDVK